MKYKISANVIRRLPRYLRRLTIMERFGTERTSSGELGGAMGLTASQIRQDFNCFGGFGQQGYGYRVADLRGSISSVLGIQETLNVIIIGAGNLGRALMSNFRFSDCGFAAIAAFDSDKRYIGQTVGGVPILDVSALEGFLADNRVDVAVFTMPQKYARDAAVLVSSKGVRGIWNFTGIDIDADLGDTIVENVHLSDSLLTLGYYLRGRTADTAPNKEEK